MEPATPLTLTVDGSPVEVPEDGATLLDVLRDRCGVTSANRPCRVPQTGGRVAKTI